MVDSFRMQEIQCDPSGEAKDQYDDRNEYHQEYEHGRPVDGRQKIFEKLGHAGVLFIVLGNPKLSCFDFRNFCQCRSRDDIAVCSEIPAEAHWRNACLPRYVEYLAAVPEIDAAVSSLIASFLVPPGND